MSKIWFSGSKNSNKMKSIMSDHHVTLETIVGQGHMAKWSINIIPGCINATEVIRVSRIWFSGSRSHGLNGRSKLSQDVLMLQR